MAGINGPKIITNGLVFYIDAASSTPYPTSPISSGLVMWMDAADANVFSYSSGTTVSEWRDKSGSNYHMTVKAGSVGPKRNVARNGRMVLGFDASNMVLQNTSINLATSANTVFVVSRYSQTANTAVIQRILTSTGNNWLLGHWGLNYNQYYAEGWVQYQGYSYDTTWRMYMGDWSGSGTDLANLYSNGTRIVSNSTGAGAGPNGISINGSEPSICEVAEIIVYNKVLSDLERKTVHTYLSRKWGFSNPDYIIYDESANNNNGQFFNGAVLDSTKGGSIVFNGYGPNNYVNCGNVSVSTTALSVMAWIYDTDTGGNHRDFITKIGTFKFRISNNSEGGTLSAFVVIGGGYEPRLTATWTKNVWAHAAFTWNTNGNFRLFLNGVLQSSSSTRSGTLSTSSNNLEIGSDIGSTYYWKGNIANASIYNATLTDAQVLQNFNAQRGRFGI